VFAASFIEMFAERRKRAFLLSKNTFICIFDAPISSSIQGDPPHPRAAHGMARIGNKGYLFGGRHSVSNCRIQYDLMMSNELNLENISRFVEITIFIAWI
jgi:hypothetical protein